jgi:hypothetical protein
MNVPCADALCAIGGNELAGTFHGAIHIVCLTRCISIGQVIVSHCKQFYGSKGMSSNIWISNGNPDSHV